MTTEARFPKKRPDGSFSVELSFGMKGTLNSHRIAAWLADWSATNSEWVREWRGAAHAVVETDVLRWSDAYVRGPTITSITTEGIVIRLDARPDAPFWKDWMVRLIEDFVSEFPELKFEGAVESCE